jgi:hypothetical protein
VPCSDEVLEWSDRAAADALSIAVIAAVEREHREAFAEGVPA